MKEEKVNSTSTLTPLSKKFSSTTRIHSYGPVVQPGMNSQPNQRDKRLVQTPDLQAKRNAKNSGGRGFKSRPVHQIFKRIL